MPRIPRDIHVRGGTEAELVPENVQKAGLLIRRGHIVNKNRGSFAVRPHIHARKVSTAPSFGAEGPFVDPAAIHRRRLADNEAGHVEIGVARELREVNLSD